MVDLDLFLEEAKQHGLCEPYGKRLGKCVSNKGLFDICCEVQAVEFIAKAVTEGWGLTSGYLAERFLYFVNGRYKATITSVSGTEYTSSVYACYDGEVMADTSVCAFFGCNASVRIAENNVCRIITDKNTSLVIDVPSTSSVLVATYSDNIRIGGKSKGKCRIVGMK